MYTYYYTSPIGTLEIKADNEYIVGLNFRKENHSNSGKDIPPIVNDCIKQLDEYFLGKRKIFTIPYTHTGTDFQKQVWKSLESIPYGTTISYADQAKYIGNPKAVRAVGGTNGKNQIGIIVPCHRVIGKNGKLTGYAGGIRIKEWLLNHEKENS